MSYYDSRRFFRFFCVFMTFFFRKSTPISGQNRHFPLKSGVFAHFSCLAGVATPFDKGIIYIFKDIGCPLHESAVNSRLNFEFSTLVLDAENLVSFQVTQGQVGRSRTVCVGRSVLLCNRFTRASVSASLRFHAFFYWNRSGFLNKCQKRNAY